MSFNYYTFIYNWEAWLISAMSLITSASCCIVLNALPKTGHGWHKIIVAMVGLGTFGTATGPLFGQGLTPSYFHVLTAVGVCFFSVWMTSDHWRELLMLPMRHVSDRTQQMHKRIHW